MKRIAAAVFAAALFGSPVVSAQTTKGSSDKAPGHTTDPAGPKAVAPGQQMKDPNSTTTGPGASPFAPGTPTPPAHGAGGKNK